MANHDGLSDVVRRQLHDLRIDADRTDNLRPGLSSRVKVWCGERKEAIALIGAAAGVIVCIVVVVVVLASTASTSAVGGGPQSASVSLGAVTVLVVPPAVRRFSPSEVALFVHVDLHNTLPTEAELLAGDVLLADPHGALFAPSWHDAYGNTVDGFAQPDHTLLALAPGGEVQVDLEFLVLSNGPFSVQHRPRAELDRPEAPSISLLPNPMVPVEAPTGI